MSTHLQEAGFSKRTTFSLDFFVFLENFCIMDSERSDSMQFERFISLVGEESFEKVRKLRVLIVGVGGVGGYVVEALARCGVGTLILVDPDRVDETNINRQIIATRKTVGRRKVEVFKERIHDISEQCECIAISEKISSLNISILGTYQPDFIVDACDDLNAKKSIIKYAVQHQISLISSMGTGKRLDPSKLEITTLDKTSYDPIAKILRKFVRDEQIPSKVTVLASREIPIQTESSEIASCSFVPASAGLLIASYMIRNILTKKAE